MEFNKDVSKDPNASYMSAMNTDKNKSFNDTYASLMHNTSQMSVKTRKQNHKSYLKQVSSLSLFSAITPCAH